MARTRHDTADLTSPTRRSDAEAAMSTNLHATLASALVTGVSGLAFWMLAGRLYPTSTVGTGAVLINTAVMVSTIVTTSVGTVYERFLADAHRATGRLIVIGQTGAAVLTATVCTLVAALGPLSTTLHGPAQTSAFAVFCLCVSLFAMQDHVTTGLGLARWGAYKNIAHSLCKLALLPLAAGVGSVAILLGTWWIPTIVSVAVLAACTHRAVARRRDDRPSALPSPRSMGSYLVASSAMLGVGTAVPLVIPMIVFARLGAEQNAYFTIAWSIASAAVIALHMLVGPVVAQIAAAPTEAGALLTRFAAVLLGWSVVEAAGLALIGPVFLGVVGHEYRTQATSLLFFAAAVLPLAAISVLYQAIARTERRLRWALIGQMLSAAIVLGGCVASDLDRLAVVGLWFLIGEAVSATLASILLITPVRAMRAGTWTVPAPEQPAEVLR